MSHGAMGFFPNFDLFSRSVENRFVFHLFDLLLCGIIVLVIARSWRTGAIRGREQQFLLIAFLLLGAAFAWGAFSTGAFLFVRKRLPARPAEHWVTTLQIGAWLALGAAAYFGRVLRRGRLWRGAIAFLLAATLLHLSLWRSPSAGAWNIEQLSWLSALFLFALALGEAGQDLFDRIFIRLQITFVLLASGLLLVILQTENTEYQAGIRSRSHPLAEFVRAHVDYYRQRKASLEVAVDHEDFLRRLALGFGELPELKVVRITAGGQCVQFEIGPAGVIQRSVEPAASPAPSLNSEEYFHMQALPFGSTGRVDLHGTREILDQHLRRRIVLMFSLFTGTVALSTMMIGWVVRGASLTIQHQAQQIEEAQRQLMHASKLVAIGELAAGVAHEINNPATAILSRASFLVSESGGSARGDLEAIVAQAQRIAQITRELLIFSRPRRLDFKAVPIERVIETALHSAGDLLMPAHVSAQTEVAPELPAVRGDEANLARALENLIRNSVDAMPCGGILTIRACAIGGSVRVEVEDTGTGITEDHLPRIFDPFFTTKDVGKGTGLGLSIVHGIVKEHGGSIAVQSRPGAGARFELSLPAESAS